MTGVRSVVGPGSSRSEVVAFLGLGRIGLPIAANVAAHGYRVQAYDPSPAARTRASDRGIQVHSDQAAAIGRARTVMTILPDASVVAALAADPALGRALRDGALWIDLTSSRPEVTAAVAEGATSAGGGFVDAPVSGGVAGAERGQLTVIASGAAHDLDAARPVFGTFATTVVQVGDKPGQADAVKALNNMLSAVNLTAAAEALAVAVSLGIAAEAFVDAVGSSTGASYALRTKVGAIVRDPAFSAGFTITQYLKDLRTAVDAAHRAGVKPRLGQGALATWAGLAEQGAGQADHAQVVALVLEEWGQRLPGRSSPAE